MHRVLLLLLILWPTLHLLATPIDNDREACDRYREEKEHADVNSPQSYVAQANLQRTLHEVNELKIQNERQQNRLLLFHILGGLLLLGSIAFSIHKLRRINQHLRLSEQELEQARQEAEQSTFRKNLLLSNMSHEIRTPLNALSGFSAILTENNVDAEMRQQCNEIIQQNSDLLVKLIDDVVDLSNLERGNLSFHYTHEEVVSLCRKVVDTVERIKQTSAAVCFSTPFTELMLTTDATRLQQLLINLLINATKFTPAGSITLSLELRDQEVLFSVTDTGCGISPDQHDKVFNRFEKLNELSQGSGLGLSICQLIIQELGGHIWIDPDYHDGARFCFTHPLHRQPIEARKEITT